MSSEKVNPEEQTTGEIPDPTSALLSEFLDTLKDSILDAEERQRLLKYLLATVGAGVRPLTDEERAYIHTPVPKPLASPDIAGVAKFIKEGHAKNIIVMSGAGISVSAGIPDFRSASGLYNDPELKKYGFDDPQDLFSISYFRENPKPFYEIVKRLYPDQFHPTKTHYFIKLLAKHGLLLRNFTQNIDTLEFIAGVPQDKVVYSHGSFAKSHCVECHKEYSYEYVREKVFANEIAVCDCGACIKPDITFFGEKLPDEFFEKMETDFPKCDLLIVMGTSLKVQPFAGLISHVPETVPRLLINYEVVAAKAPLAEGASEYEQYRYRTSTKFAFNDPENRRDALFQGPCDVGVQELANALGWGEELQEMFDAPVEFKHEKFEHEK